jgi:hypothetical protein
MVLYETDFKPMNSNIAFSLLLPTSSDIACSFQSLATSTQMLMWSLTRCAAVSKTAAQFSKHHLPSRVAQQHSKTKTVSCGTQSNPKRLHVMQVTTLPQAETCTDAEAAAAPSVVRSGFWHCSAA